MDLCPSISVEIQLKHSKVDAIKQHIDLKLLRKIKQR